MACCIQGAHGSVHAAAYVPARRYILFYCEFPAQSGGSTPIIPSSAVARHLREMHPAFAERLAAKGIRYVRVMPEVEDRSSPIGKSWKASFDASTRQEAEAAMAEVGTTWEWYENGDVRTETKAMPALVVDESGREMFFNSAIAAFQGWMDVRNDPRKAIVFGDGSPLDDDHCAAMEEIGEYMRQSRVAFEWKAGD
eukprot:156541-Prymnesium_polylepis.1